MPHRFEERHQTKNIVVACSDFRLGQGERRVLTEFGIVDPDVIKLPGGCGSLASIDFPGYEEVTLHAVSALIGLHKVEKVVLLSHQSCGAYGACGHRFDPCTFSEDERNFHHKELRKAKERLRTHLDAHAFEDIDIMIGVQYVNEDDEMHIEWVVK
jgi:carbonic anhydrase